MRKLRFNIATLLLVVLVVAVGVAALRESNEPWDSGLLSLTLGVLLASFLLAVHRSGAKRAFWIGFALFGWGYLGLSLVPSIESRLITTKVLGYLDSKLPGRFVRSFTARFSGTGSGALNNQVQSVVFSSDGSTIVTSRPSMVYLWDAATGRLLGGWGGATDHRIRIGHTLFALLAGWLGGVLSRWLGRVSRAPEVSTEEGAGG